VMIVPPTVILSLNTSGLPTVIDPPEYEFRLSV
jgi:hypothetical protein